MINGQNHKGSTYHIGKMLADKLGGEVTEFFLPRDFGHFCVGCNQCIVKDEKLCPYYKELKPLTEAIDSADVIILTLRPPMLTEVMVVGSPVGMMTVIPPLKVSPIFMSSK